MRIASGESHTLMLTASGRVSSCGLSTFGQLGEALRHEHMPSPGRELVRQVHQRSQSMTGCLDHPSRLISCHDIPPHLRMTIIEASRIMIHQIFVLRTSVANLSSRRAHVAGSGSLDARNKPAEVAALWMLGIVQVSAGENHSAALTANGRVVSWGRGKYGQLGTGDTQTAAAPRFVPLLPNTMQASPG